MNTTRPLTEEDDLRLAEYALGVLTAEERKEVESHIETDPDHALALARWNQRLAPLCEAIPDAQPPGYLWARICGELAFDPPAKARSETRRPFFENLQLWRWLSAVGLTAAVVLGIALLNDRFIEPTSNVMLNAALKSEAGQTAFVATLDQARRQLVVTPVGAIASDDRVAELWLIADGDQPRSLGLLSVESAVSITVSEDLVSLAQVSSVFAVSLEPPGGSPSGAPTGPVIAQGELSNI